MPDVVVIGGGVMGLAAARELRGRGLSVTLVERGQPGRAASWASAGIISAPIGSDADPSFQLAAFSYRLWPEFAAALAAETGFDPEFRLPGCLVLALAKEDIPALRQVQLQGGLAESAFLEGDALRKAEPALGPAVHAALRKPGGNVENRRLCQALELAARRRGVEFRCGQDVRAIRMEGDRVTGVEVADGMLAAERVLVTAGAWSGTLAGCRPAVPVSPQRGQVLALEAGDIRLQHVIMASGNRYLVPRAAGHIIVAATREEAGWDASLTAGGVAWLLDSALQIAPTLAGCSIRDMWTGFRPISSDGLPIIGLGTIRGLSFATGHGPSGIGQLPGTIALLQALLFDAPPPIPPTAYSPARFGQTGTRSPR
jgi:glycine oxidase